MVWQFSKYLFPRVSAPVMTLITLGVLARYLDAEDYSDYLYFYAIAVIVSGLSDGGIRDSHYYLVSKSLSQKLFNQIYKVKLLVTLIIFIVAFLLNILLPQVSISVAFTVALLSCTLPVSDVGLMILKAKNMPSLELFLSIFEGSTAITIFLILGSQNLSFELCMLVISILGFFRSLISFLLAKNCVEKMAKNIVPKRYGLKRSTSVLPIFLGNLYNRVPALVLVDLIPAQSYNVLITFLTLVQRMEVIPTALLQSQLSNFKVYGGLSGNIVNLIIILTVMGLLAVGLSMVLAEQLVLLVMGNGYVDFTNDALIIFYVIPFVLVAYGARYFLQLELKVKSSSLWLCFCLVQSLLTLYLFEITQNRAHALWINYFIYTTGFILILKNYLTSKSEKKNVGL